MREQSTHSRVCSCCASNPNYLSLCALCCSTLWTLAPLNYKLQPRQQQTAHVPSAQVQAAPTATHGRPCHRCVLSSIKRWRLHHNKQTLQAYRACQKHSSRRLRNTHTCCTHASRDFYLDSSAASTITHTPAANCLHNRDRHQHSQQHVQASAQAAVQQAAGACQILSRMSNMGASSVSKGPSHAR
jgi:hypothetical protein